MRIPPKKPHFFKPILSGFKNGVMIPDSFIKILNGMKCDHAVLRRGCQKWSVKINGRHFKDGWRKFAEDNDLHVGDIVLFKHEGNMVFKVMVFDRSQCEREYTYQACDVEEAEPRKAKEMILEKPSAKLKLSRSDEISRGKRSMKVSVEKTSEHAHPYFVTTLKPFNIQQSRMNIPMNFAKANGLCKRKCKMILKDQRQRSWSVGLNYARTHVYIQGWQEFRIGNGLREGDHLMFELIDSGQQPVMKIYDLEGNQSAQHIRTKRSLSTLDEVPQPTNLEGKSTRSTHADGSDQEQKQPVTHLEAKRTFSSASDHPYFVSTVIPSARRWPYLTIPMMFARSNGLHKHCCEAILIDSSERSWPIKLVPKATQVIMRGWGKFSTDSELKEGDLFKLELIKKGEKPIMKFQLIKKGYLPMMKFHDLEGKKSAPRVGTRRSLSTLDEGLNLEDKHEPKNLEGKSIRSTHADGSDQENKQPATHLEAKRTFSSASDHPYFVSTVKPYARRWPYLSIPMMFARSNGIRKRCYEVILIDPSERSWHVELVRKATRIIMRGWGKFFTENGLKEGDTFKIELIKKGDIPIMKFQLIKKGDFR